MKTKLKASGFFIVEILIVLAIVAILVTALLPNLNLYTSRAKYADVLTTANSIKPAVELCILQTGTPNTAISTCVQNSNGVPAETTIGYSTNVSGFSVTSAGVIIATGAGGALSTRTYVLVPTFNANGTVNWSDTSPNSPAPGSCKASGLC